MGKAAECPVFPVSDAPCSTLPGYTISLPTQFETFLPYPEPVSDVFLCMSFSDKSFNLFLLHSPIGTFTSS